MPSVHFAGRVLPAALRVSVPNRPTFHWKADDLGLEMTFHVRIEDGSVAIDCDVSRFDESAHLVPLFMRASDIARATVDLAAFAIGQALTVILETFTDPSGAVVQLAARHPSLAPRATAARPGTPDFDKILQYVLAEPPLFMALQDLIEAVSAPHRAELNCARAIGALRPYFGLPGGSPEAAGLALRENLQVTKAYVSRITQYGDRPHVPATPITDVIDRAWIVMNRFLEYRKRGGQPLPLSEFPLLT
jgi:hypothetical protein